MYVCLLEGPGVVDGIEPDLAVRHTAVRPALVLLDDGDDGTFHEHQSLRITTAVIVVENLHLSSRRLWRWLWGWSLSLGWSLLLLLLLLLLRLLLGLGKA